MDIRYLLIAAGTGLFVGLMVVFGLVDATWEIALWAIASIVWVVVGRKRLLEDRFRHVVLGAAIAGFLAADVKVLLWDTYLANQPSVAQLVVEEELDSAPRTGVLLSGVTVGVLYGLVVALFLRLTQGPQAASTLDEEE